MNLPDGKGTKRSPSIIWAGLLCRCGVLRTAERWSRWPGPLTLSDPGAIVLAYSEGLRQVSPR
jgi:hypothetical protein